MSSDQLIALGKCRAARDKRWQDDLVTLNVLGEESVV